MKLKILNIKKMITLFTLLSILTILVFHYYLENNSTEIPKSATLVELFIGSEEDG